MGISETEQNLSQLRIIKNQAYSAMFQIFFYPTTKINQKKTFVFKNDMFVSDFSDFDTAYERFIGRLEYLEANEITTGVNSLFNFSSIPEKKTRNCFILFIQQSCFKFIFSFSRSC